MESYDKGRSVATTLMVLGTAIFIMGILIYSGWLIFQQTEYIEYGGDAFTGIQNAAADTANNIVKTCGILCSILGLLASQSGSILLHYFDIKKFEINETNKRHNEILSLLTENVNNNSSITAINNNEQTTTQQYLCPLCNSPITYGAKKCDKCNADIDWNLKQ